MELALSIIEITGMIIMVCIVASFIWGYKLKKEGILTIIQLVLFVVLFALEISRLILQVSIGKPYAITIVLIIMWVVMISLLTSEITIRTILKEEEENSIVNVAIKITEYTNQDEDDETSESKQTD